MPLENRNNLAPRSNPVLARTLIWLGRRQWTVLFRLLSAFLGGDIPCRSYNGLILPHPYGITIREKVRIGANCVIYQNVTIGARHDGDGPTIIGDEVLIGANAVILGEVEIGKGATIGAGAVVVTSIPDGGLAVGNPARVVMR